MTFRCPYCNMGYVAEPAPRTPRTMTSHLQEPFRFVPCRRCHGTGTLVPRAAAGLAAPMNQPIIPWAKLVFTATIRPEHSPVYRKDIP